MSLQPRASHLTRPRWWLWPNVLSLDAPAVAVAWQLLFARSVGIRLHPVTTALLAQAAWCVYALDRLLDAQAKDAALSPGWRHAFYRKHQRAVWVAVLAVASASAPLALLALPEPVKRGGFVLVLVMAGYLGVVHLPFLRSRDWLPKEYAVGALFAAGVTVPFWSRMVKFEPLETAAFALFAVACQVNAVAVEYWESSAAGRVVATRATLWLGRRIGWAAALLSIAGFAMPIAASRFDAVFACVGASAALMAAVAWKRKDLGAVASCSLMDLALLTPLGFDCAALMGLR
jgi:hypothetical protein